jgi:hypothetical protein
MVDAATTDGKVEEWGTMDNKKVLGISTLSDGRIEVLWEPVDENIPEDMEYLSSRSDLPISKTETQAKFRDDPMHYIFDKSGLWSGIRCPKEIWARYLSSDTKGEAAWKQNDVEAFYKKLEAAPNKLVLLPKAE